MLSKIWIIMVLASIIVGIITGKTADVSAGVLLGAKAAVELCIAIAGPVCLWSGVMRVMSDSGMTAVISKRISPALGFIFPNEKKNKAVMEAIGTNITANILGLGNAATPMGIKAAGMLQNPGGVAGDSLCMLVVVNTASLQLIPATIASVRMTYGAANPFDILPAVWISSVAALAGGIIIAKICSVPLGAKKTEAKSAVSR